MSAAEISVAEGAVADHALGKVLAVPKRASLFLGRGHAAAQGQDQMQGGFALDGVVA